GAVRCLYVQLRIGQCTRQAQRPFLQLAVPFLPRFFKLLTFPDVNKHESNDDKFKPNSSGGDGDNDSDMPKAMARPIYNARSSVPSSSPSAHKRKDPRKGLAEKD
ncbi:hypothetical protein FRC09_004997, partial [Ceratobasidium sp. 395]